MSPDQYIEIPEPRNPEVPVPTYAYAGMCVPVVMLLLCIGCTWEGAGTQDTKVVRQEILVPTPREARLLAAFALPPQSERGQKKLRKFRQQQQQLADMRERLRGRLAAGSNSGQAQDPGRYPRRQSGIQTLVYALQARAPVPPDR